MIEWKFPKIWNLSFPGNLTDKKFLSYGKSDSVKLAFLTPKLWQNGRHNN